MTAKRKSKAKAHTRWGARLRPYAYIFLRYCPPTSNIACVSCPRAQYLVTSISTANSS